MLNYTTKSNLLFTNAHWGGVLLGKIKILKVGINTKLLKYNLKLWKKQKNILQTKK